MTKTTVIFTLTSQEAQYAVSYLRAHPKEKVKILAPDLPAQLVLKKEKVASADYFLKEYFVSDYFTKVVESYGKIARRYTRSVLKKMVEKFPQYKNILYPLQNRLELVYLELVDAFHFYQAMESQWQPKKYLICQDYLPYNKIKYSTYQPAPSQAAQIFSFFVPPQKREVFQVRQPAAPLKWKLEMFAGKIGHPLSWLNKIKALAYRFADQIRYLFFQPDKVDVLIYSGGRNLDCYYRLFSLFNSANFPISYQVVSYPQLLEEELRVRKHRIDFVPLSFFATKLERGKISRLTQQVEQDLKNWFDKVSSSSLFGKNIDPLLSKALLTKTKDIFAENLPANIRQMLLAQYTVKLYQPKLVITTHDPGPAAMPFVLVAKEQKIKTLVFMHGWQDVILGIDHRSDMLATWGKYVADWYVKKMGKKPSWVKAVGYPAFDDPFLSKEAFWQKKDDIKPLSSPIRLSLLLTLYLPHTALLSIFFEKFFKTFAKYSQDFHLSIRTHPGQKTDGIKELAQMYGVKVKINPPVNLENFIKSSDVIFSWDTTAMFWAFIYGKPVFYCSPSWYWGITPIKELGGAWLVTGADDLFKKITQLKKDISLQVELRRQQYQFLRQIIGVLDGTASEEHLNLICQLLQKTKEIKV